MKNILPKSNRGFTLIELLVVIGVLTILLSIVLIAINPQRQFQQANDTQRRSDVSAILNAIHQYSADNSGSLPSAISTSEGIIVSGSSAGQIDICDDLVPTYIAEMPVDPTSGSYTDCDTYSAGYSVVSTSSNRVTVSANSEVTPAEEISVTR